MKNFISFNLTPFRFLKEKLSLILLCSIPFIIASPSANSFLIKESPKEVIDQVWQIVYRDYLDSSGEYDKEKWLSLRRNILKAKYFDQTGSHEAIRQMLSTLNDPYTRFLDPREFKDMMRDTSGELMGVGIQISIDEESNRIVVVSPIEDTPAFKAGVKSNDFIISINDIPTNGMSIEKAVDLIRGKRGTEVSLGLLRNGELIKVNLVRDRISINVVASHMNSSQYGFKIGYIRLKQFNANSARDMKNTIRKLEDQEAMAYVIDLRSNPGGLLEASIEIARQWINKGIIVSTSSKDGVSDIRRANGTALTDNPVAVLVNEGSASASEILSGAIQDNKRGILVGTKTFGKGLVQSVRSLSDGSGMIVTVAKYLTPKGVDINKNGIHPDFQVELTSTQLQTLTNKDLGTKKDPQYIVAQTELDKVLRKSQRISNFKSSGSNLKSALTKGNIK